MSLPDFLTELNEETKAITSADFSFDVTQARALPNTDDPALTFENFDRKSKGVKLIETCVLYIDIRKSTKLSFQHRPETLSKLYSSFVRGSIKCADYYNGHVRNIIGDRVMILFDPQDCFKNAVNAGILINTFVSYVLDRNFKYNDVACGIGIDHGPMLVTKIGTIKRGSLRSEYRSLVWLGKPANIASKLTDIANKTITRPVVHVARRRLFSEEWEWQDQEIKQFFDGLETVYEPGIIARFKDPLLANFFLSSASQTYKTILMTDRVFRGFKSNCPNEDSIKNNWWTKVPVSIEGLNGTAYQGNVIYTCGRDL